MALERRNPLPPGWYWVDVPDTKRRPWEDWLERNADSVSVKETREVSLNQLSSALFQVTSPVTWEGPGLPTIAQEGTTLDDTVERPEPEPEIVDEILETVKSGRGLMWVIGAGIAGGIALWLAKK